MTESWLAQETLRESEQLARGIIDTALDAFVQMDNDGTISDWNSQAQKIFGWSRSEALGRNLGELIIPDITAPLTNRACNVSCAPEKARSSDPVSKSRLGDATEKKSGRTEHHAFETPRRRCVQRIVRDLTDRSRPRIGSGRPKDGSRRPAHRRDRS